MRSRCWKRLLWFCRDPRHWVIGMLLGMISGCHIDTIMRSSAQEKAFRARYVGQSFYTAMVIQPYRYGEDYLIDLTGKVTEIDAQAFRAPIVVPLGAPVSVTDIEARHILMRIQGYSQIFRVLVEAERGSVDDIAKELSVLLSVGAPLLLARPEIRPYIERQELARGMSAREIYMSWGQPDKVNGTPGASGVWEQWLFHSRRAHLYLQNGMLTNWEYF